MDAQADKVMRDDTPSPGVASDSDLRELKASDIWRYLKTQDALFWLINIYMFMEYVRPQTLYPFIDVFPIPRSILLLTLGLFFLRHNSAIVKSPLNKIIFLFLIVILLSSVLALSPSVAFENMPRFMVWMIIYFLIINIINTEKRFLVFILAFFLYNFKMSQFSFRNWAVAGFGFLKDGSGGGPGWFQNSGEFGIQMCIFLSLVFFFYIALKEYWPRWKKGVFLLFPLFALSGTISSSSRGGLVGAGAVLMWMLLKSRHKLKGLAALVLVGMLVFAFLPAEQKARLETAGSEQDKTSQNRLERWAKGREMVARYPALGVGYANWGVADRALFGGDGAFPHNIFIECTSELGYAGLTVFMLMILYTFVINHQTRKFASQTSDKNRFNYFMAHGLDGALVGYLVSGFFVSVLYYPYFWMNLAMTVALNNIARNDGSQKP